MHNKLRDSFHDPADWLYGVLLLIFNLVFYVFLCAVIGFTLETILITILTFLFVIAFWLKDQPVTDWNW